MRMPIASPSLEWMLITLPRWAGVVLPGAKYYLGDPVSFNDLSNKRFGLGIGETSQWSEDLCG